MRIKFETTTKTENRPVLNSQRRNRDEALIPPLPGSLPVISIIGEMQKKAGPIGPT